MSLKEYSESNFLIYSAEPCQMNNWTYAFLIQIDLVGIIQIFKYVCLSDSYNIQK